MRKLIIFLILNIFLINIVLADDDIYIITGNKLSKNNNYSVILSEDILGYKIDNNSVYINTNNVLYSINKTNGYINYKTNIINIKSIELSDNFIYVRTVTNIYKINKLSGVIENNNFKESDTIFTFLFGDLGVSNTVLNSTTVTNIINVSKINLSQVNTFEKWNASYVNGSNAEGTLLTTPMRRNLDDYTTFFFAPGSYEGNFRMGSTNKSLIPEVDINGDFGYQNDPTSNYATLETKGRTRDTALITKVKFNGSVTEMIQSTELFNFAFDGNHISIGGGTDSIAGHRYGLDMNDNFIYNSPDISYMWSTGVISGGNITFYPSSGTINITSGMSMIRKGVSDTDKLIAVNFSGKNFSIVYGETKFIYLEFSPPGTIELKETSSITDISGTNQIQLYQTFKNDEFHYIDARGQNIASGKKLRSLLYDTNRFLHAADGSIISNPSDLNVSITAGRYYYGLNSINHEAKNTATGDKIEYYYHNSTYSWFSYQTSKLNETYYNPTSGLDTMLPNKYKVEWIYMILSSDGSSEMAALFGNTQYSNLGDAQLELAPGNVPLEVSDIGVLVGRVIIKQGDLSPISTESAFKTTFTTSATTLHNSLSNLQGGALNEYYHINFSSYTNYIINFISSVRGSISTGQNLSYNVNTGVIDDFRPKKVNISGDTMNGILNMSNNGIIMENTTLATIQNRYRIDNIISNGYRPYQLSLNISNLIGTNNATHVFCNGHCNNNFTDINFTINNVTELSYWIQNNDSGKLWVNVTSNGTVNMNYGNNSSISNYNGTTTFIAYHGFSNTQFNDSNILTIPFIFEGRFKKISGDSVGIGVSNTGDMSSSGLLVSRNINVHDYTPLNNAYFGVGNSVTYGESVEPPFIPSFYSDIIIKANTTHIIYNVTGHSIITRTTNIPTNTMGLSMYLYGGAGEQLYSFARYYTLIEPSWATWGNENVYNIGNPASTTSWCLKVSYTGVLYTTSGVC